MNLNSEIRQGYHIPKEMKAVWKVQMEIAQKIVEVCNRYNLKVWYDSGSMLGAIREKGFIPWDDDIDLGMMREDFEKLLSVSDKEFEYPYFFQTGYNDKGFFACHAKVRRSDTTGALICETFNRYNQGIFVDIFIFDKVPSTERALEIHNILNPLRERMVNTGIEFFTPINLYKRLCATIYFFFHDYSNYFSVIDNIAKQYEHSDCEYVTSLTYPYGHPERNIHRKSLYDEIIFVPFEDIMVPVPKGYDEILTNWYGDYMKPSKIPTIHGTAIFDTHTPYKELIPKLRRARLREKFMQLLRLIKH